MRQFILRACLGVLTLCTAVWAADIAGKWTGQVPGRGDNTAETTFVFKVEGETLTGTVTGRGGERPILDGKVSGDSISFAVEGAQGRKQLYKGTVSGDEIKFTRQGGQGEPRPFTAKRVK